MPTAVFLVAGWVAAYLTLREVLDHRREDVRRELQEQINMLTAHVQVLEHALGSGPLADTPSADITSVGNGEQTVRRAEPIAWPVAAAEPEDESIPPETMALISETVAGVVGRPLRIVSARKLPAQPPPPAPEPSADAWAQQGRVLVQTSHEAVHGRPLAPPAASAVSSPLRGVIFEDTDFN